MMRLIVAGLLVIVFAAGAHAQGGVVKRALAVDPETQAQRIDNGGLETLDEDGFLGWRPWELGYEVDREVRRSGNFSARCHNATADEHRGMTYVVELNQTTPAPIMAEAWSRAEEVTGGLDGNYSLYLDLEYMDGTPLWGQIAPFRPGTHDWERRTVTVLPSKPVRSVSVHGIFRARTGTAWFDDFKLWELALPGGVQQFDAVPVTPGDTDAEAHRWPGAYLPVALYLRDVGAGSDFIQPAFTVTAADDGAPMLEGRVEDLELVLTATFRDLGDALRIDGHIRDLSGRDRAVSVYCGVSLDAVGWTWHHDQRTTREIEAEGRYQDWVSVGAGANRQASRFPLACVSGPEEAVAIGAPLDVPRLYRFAYEAEARELYGVVDLGLAPDTLNFPSQATFSFLLYRSDPAWGYRAALQRYYDLLPDCFTKRNDREGIWMPFVDIATVEGFEDFGFQFQEGAPNVAFDEEHGIYSFVYVEPMSHWLAMPADMERSNERALAFMRELAEGGNRQAQATRSSALENAEGDWYGGITKAPWCDGALYYLNPSPAVMGEDEEAVTKFHLDAGHIARFAENPAGARAGWRNWEQGYALAPGEGRDGSAAAKVSRTEGGPGAGASQSVLLRQTEPTPLVARVWTRSENVTGEASGNYSLYIDLKHTDGTDRWGLVVRGRTGTNDWTLLEQTIVPEKPVQSAAFHLLLRAPHTGTAWFDDAFLGEVGSDENLLRNADFEPADAPSDVVPFLDGTYIDSFEMAASTLNYRREHFAHTATPLVFDSEGRVAQMQVFNTVEFARELALRMWAEGRMMFANSTPYRFAWGAPWLDVMGTETNWAPGTTFTQERGWTGGGVYRPDGDSIMNLRRAVCHQRPYLLLLNTVFQDFRPEWVELYMKRCAFYAVFPSMFSHDASSDVYWTRPNLYNRDRPLFKKYIPVISALNAAGWEPITHARSDNPQVYVERYGKPGGPLYLTLFNDSGEEQTAAVTVEATALGLAADLRQVGEEFTGGVFELEPAAEGARLMRVTIAPEDVLVLRLGE